MKLINKIVSIALILGSLVLISCTTSELTTNSSEKPSINDTQVPTTDENELEKKQKQVYLLALESGYEGTYEEWLESIKGDSISLQVANNYIQWKYNSSNQWKNLIPINDLIGEDGQPGQNPEFKVIDGILKWKYTDEGYNSWKSLITFGTQGALVEYATIKFDTDGGSYVADQIIRKGYNIVQPINPKKEGYEFDGWYLDDQKWYFPGYSTSNDITLKAKWIDITNRIYLYVGNEIEQTLKFLDNEVAQNPIVSLPILDKPGLIFNGWKDEEGNVVTEVDLTGKKEVKIYADYELIEYKITFIDPEENVIKEQFINYGNTINLPEIDVNSGEKVVWYLVYDDSKVKLENEYFNYIDDITLTYQIELQDLYEYDAEGLDIYINYQGKHGVSLVENSFVNTVENTLYCKGDLLPTWKALAQYVKTDIRDASDYSVYTDNDSYRLLESRDYISLTNYEYVDLFYNTTANINKMGAAGKAVNLLDYLEYMPNFAQFLDSNPTIKSAITRGGAIYYTPYFDGYNAIERMFIMDTNMVKAVLDVDSHTQFDQTINGGSNPAHNVVQAGNYTPFIDTKYNYPDKETTVLISKDTIASEITINQTDNIILQQNELLAVGCTGQELAQQFKTYLEQAFGHLVGTGKTYENYSDIFVSESAAYNADELIALMRVIKANPGVVTGDSNAEIEMLVPRGVTNNRVDNIADFMQIWGIQGLDSEKDMVYFDANGKLNDAASTMQTYDALQYLSAIYDEGLILENFWDKNNLLGSTGYLNKYFGKTVDNGGYGFMMYDYSASIGAVNSIYDGVGTADDKRVGVFANTAVTGVMPVVTPLSYWATESNWSVDQSLTNHTGKTLIRYSESNRALKTTSWCIPANSDNPEKAAQLMDYLLTTEGSVINCFGPTQYWEVILGEYAGQPTPIMDTNLKNMIAASGIDFWSFMRGYLGATHGIGHVRSMALNYQATNHYAKIGTKNIENAIASGAIKLAMVDKYDEYTFDTSVPMSGYGSPYNSFSYDAVESFWASDKCNTTPQGWVAVIVGGFGNNTQTSTGTLGSGIFTGSNYSLKDVYDQIDERRTDYLYVIVSGLDQNLVPDYAYPYI